MSIYIHLKYDKTAIILQDIRRFAAKYRQAEEQSGASGDGFLRPTKKRSRLQTER